MKKTTIYIYFLLFTLIGFSQSKTQIHGRVLWQENAVKNADVINFTTKKNTITNDSGDFYIEAKANDYLIIFSKEHLDKKVFISQSDMSKSVIIIQLQLKIIELDEVKIFTTPEIKLKVGYNEINAAKLAKQQSRPQPTGVYTGEIVNGMDFIQIGKALYSGIKSLIKNNKKKILKPIDVFPHQYLKENFDEAFFLKILNLKTDEIEPFVEYCSKDSKVDDLIRNQSNFEIMDFLITKKNAYDKMLETENNSK